MPLSLLLPKCITRWLTPALLLVLLVPGPAATGPYEDFIDALARDLEVQLNECNGTATQYFRLKRAEDTRNSIIGLLGQAETDTSVDAALSSHVQCKQDVIEFLDQVYRALNDKACLRFVDAYQRYRLSALEQLSDIAILQGDDRQSWVRRWSGTVSGVVVDAQGLRRHACQ